MARSVSSFFRFSALAGAAAILSLGTASASAQFFPNDRAEAQGVEYSQSAEKTAIGELFLTNGLSCDDASQVDAVMTLSNSGDQLQDALQQINAGAEIPRCIVGRFLFARYVEKARTFDVKGRGFNVHRVLIIAVGMPSADGVVPMELKTPLEQFVVTSDNSRSA